MSQEFVEGFEFESFTVRNEEIMAVGSELAKALVGRDISEMNVGAHPGGLLQCTVSFWVEQKDLPTLEAIRLAVANAKE